jgi:hypothetical protein
MIAIVVAAAVFEKFVIEAIIVRRLGVRFEDLYLLKDIGKTAIISAAAGAVTFFVYNYVKGFTTQAGENLANLIFEAPKQTAADSFAGLLTLAVSFAVFAFVYLAGIVFWNVLDAEEKDYIKKIFGRLRTLFQRKQIRNPQSEI